MGVRKIPLSGANLAGVAIGPGDEVGATSLEVGRSAPCAKRSTRPVFVVGCGRSGTTLLHHMILSSGDFALFPLESNTFNLLGPRFPGLQSMRNRKLLLEFWLRTKRFAQSGLERSDIERQVLTDCRNVGDFLRVVMEAMCRKQEVRRWAEKTPDNALYISEIKRSIPEALIVHIIRDGRDVAVSLDKFGVHPFLWERGGRRLAFGVYWKWILGKVRAAAQSIRPDYYELHFEDLVEQPRRTLAQLSIFLDHDLDYDRILQVGVGAVSRPATSFRSELSEDGFNPVGRWRKQFAPEELPRFESLVGDELEKMGYALATERLSRDLSTSMLLLFYRSQLELRQWLKSSTPLRRFVGRQLKGVLA